MLTKDEIMQVGQLLNDDFSYSDIFINNNFPDILLTMYWQDGRQPCNTYISLFNKSISNEGYPTIRYRSGIYDNMNGGFDNSRKIYEDHEDNNTFVFPGQMTEDLAQRLVQAAGIFNTNINVFLSDNNPNMAIGTDNDGIPNMVVRFDQFDNRIGEYEVSKLIDLNQVVDDHGNFYEVDGRTLNQYDYEQYIENNK